MKSAEARRKILNVATAVEAEPERYRQKWWAAISIDALERIPNTGGLSIQSIEPTVCGTAFCLAGWNHLLHHAADDYWLELGFPDDDWQNLNWSATGQDLTDDIRRDFELDEAEAQLLTSSNWRPIPGVTVPAALRFIAYGASVRDVTHHEVLETWVSA